MKDNERSAVQDGSVFIDDRNDGAAKLLFKGKVWKRKASSRHTPRWFFRLPSGSLVKVRRQISDGVEVIYRDPRCIRIRRFPRLPQNRSSAPIKDFVDIPLTGTLPRRGTEWLVEGLIPRSSLVLITGLPSSFKSFLGEYLASRVSEGRDFLGRTTKQAIVLLLDRDNPLHIVEQRCQMLKMSQGDRLRIWGNWTHEPPPDIDDPRLEQFARDHQLLIIFDSLVRFHSSDENSTKEMAVVMAKLRKLVTAGATVVVLHHSPKSEPRKNKYRGSSDIHAGVDVAFNLLVDRKTNPPTITLECFKHRSTEEFTIVFRPDFEHGQFEVVSDSTAQQSDQITATLKTIIRDEPGLNQQELTERSGLGEHAVSRTLKAGEKRHWKVERPSRKEKAYYPI